MLGISSLFLRVHTSEVVVLMFNELFMVDLVHTITVMMPKWVAMMMAMMVVMRVVVLLLLLLVVVVEVVAMNLPMRLPMVVVMVMLPKWVAVMMAIVVVCNSFSQSSIGRSQFGAARYYG